MSSLFESKNIIADNYTANIFIKLRTDINIKFKEIDDSIFLHIPIKDDNLIILNTGFNPFSLNLLTKDTKIITIEDDHFWIDLWIDNDLDLIDQCIPMYTIMNNLLSRERSPIVSIPFETINNKYYMTNQHNKKDLSNTVLILPSYYVQKYMNLPIMSYKFLMSKPPTVIIPQTWSFLHIIAEFFNGSFPLMIYSEKLEFNFCLFVVLLGNGRNFRQINYPNEDIFYLYFYELDDIPIDNFIKNTDCPYYSSYLKMVETYKIFHEYYFHTEYYNFNKDLKYKVDIIKFGMISIKKDNPKFQEYIDGIINCDYLLSQCSIKNVNKHHSFYSKIMIEIFVNNKGYQFRDVPPKFKKISNIVNYLNDTITGITKLPRSEKEHLIQQMIEQNQAKLLEEEELEKERKNRKEEEKKKKLEENIKKKQENQVLSEKKKLAKKIALEAKEYLVKKEVAKKREIAKHISKMKSLAKIIALDAKIYYEKYLIQSKKEAKILQEIEIINLESKDEEYCQIGSPEYNRRILEWNLEKINPKIFCHPREKIAQLFSENSPNIWLFNLWN